MISNELQSALTCALGQKEIKVLDSGGTATYNAGSVVAIYAGADSTVTTVTTKGDNLSTTAIAAGSTVYGLFSSVTFVSGSGIVYTTGVTS